MPPTYVLLFILLSHVPGSQPFQLTNKNIISSRHRLKLPESSPCLHGNGKGVVRKSTQNKTAICMGLRSFIKKIIRSDGVEETADSKYESKSKPEDVRAALEAIKADLEAVVSLQEGSLHEVGDDDESDIQRSVDNYREVRGSNDALDPKKLTPQMRYSETIQERIMRVKSGIMTEDEKASFLNNALTRPISSNDGQKKRQPIRQSIPDSSSSAQVNIQQRLPRAFGNFRPNKGSLTTSAPTASPSPFPTDSIWNNVIGRSPSSSKASYPPKASSSSPPSKGDLDDAAKREYFNLVMNPERFKSYAAMGGSRTPAAPGTKPQVISTYIDPPENISFEARPSDGVSSTSYSLGLTATKSLESSTTSTPTPKGDKNDLAYRLEVAATLQEQRDAELKAKRESDRLAADAAAQAALEAREADIRRQQEATMEKKRLEKERKEKEELERKLEEERKMKEMIERQEEYWKNKLKKETQRKQMDEPTLSVSDKPIGRDLIEEEMIQHPSGMHIIASSAMNETEILKWRQMEMERENPHEQEILKEVSRL